MGKKGGSSRKQRHKEAERHPEKSRKSKKEYKKVAFGEALERFMVYCGVVDD